MGEEYIEREMNVLAGNARRDGGRLFELVMSKLQSATVEADV
jgi:hypothetical protein